MPYGPDQTRHSRPATLDDLKRIVQALNERNAEYILVGGYAMFAHGYHRATEDIDLLVPARREAARPILDALLVLADKAAADVPEAWFEEGENIRLADEIVVDLLFTSCGETYESLRPHVKVVEVEGVPVRTLDLDGLLKTKQSAREKDRMDRMVLERAMAALRAGPAEDPEP